MPKFANEESRQRWIEARWGGRAKENTKAERSGPPRDDLPYTIKAVAVRSTEVAVVPSLDDKIVQLRAELEILEQARDILTR